MQIPRLWGIAPQVVEFAYRSRRTIAITTEEPKISTAICPTNRDAFTSPCTGYIAGGGDSECAVDTYCISRVAAVYPCPLLGCRIELPKVVEVRICPICYDCACYWSEVVASEEPQVATTVCPTDSTVPASGRIVSGWRRGFTRRQRCSRLSVTRA